MEFGLTADALALILQTEMRKRGLVSGDLRFSDIAGCFDLISIASTVLAAEREIERRRTP